jgi:eukaryotic-like serine/threonine-protein kinase
MAAGVPYGDYLLVRRIGSGAMAEVFLARRKGHKGFEKQLVIKRLMPHLSSNPRFADMFVNEARLAALIDHPNLAHVSDFGEVGGTYFLAMEYVGGLTLADFLDTTGRLTHGVAARIAIDLLEALHAIHTARSLDGAPMRLVHRDVSTRNVMLRNDGAVKLLDFGIAIPSTAAPSGEKIGTRGFMSPEQTAGRALDARSDLYSVGVLLYRMIAGAMPPEGDPDPSLANVPRELAEIISAALAQDPDERPGSARQMQSALEVFLAARGAEGTRSHLASLVLGARRVSSDAGMGLMERLTRVTRMTRAVEETSSAKTPASAKLLLAGVGLAAAAALALLVSMITSESPRELPTLEVASAPPDPPVGPASSTVAATASVAPATEPLGELERPASAPARPRAPKHGTLAVDTSPWSEVYLDGRRLGVTPLEEKNVAAGPHLLDLVQPESGVKKRLRVVIKGGSVKSVYQDLGGR